MTYRKMGEADIERAVSLYIAYYNTYEGGEWTRETARRRIRQVLTREDAYCLVLEENGDLAAFAMGYFEQYDDGFAYDLIEIVVAAERQKQGLGTAFMKELEARVKAQGAMLIQLEAVNDDFHEHFYGKLGYGTVRNFVLKSKIL
ncbi:MAG: GNAT family N-acetyltransferase [Clostridia bacterium]|nr:GNAT family N-acetyltransferase [Clostridia bacterium]